MQVLRRLLIGAGADGGLFVFEGASSSEFTFPFSNDGTIPNIIQWASFSLFMMASPLLFFRP
ncbi:hypothetical protein OKW34_003949 [Paraburkholderia youngii]|uniref:Uncharacterized protein n=1 Tax=Paraburkholderia youngii TaxID=2782701 RepID=A0A7W8LC79_9BURK|nr:hypothetical protein [Paraburkholderia youngii]